MGFNEGSLFVLDTFSRIEEFGSSQRDVGRDLDCRAGRVVVFTSGLMTFFGKG